MKTVKDWHLGIFVLVVVSIDVLLIGVLTAFEGARIQATLIQGKEHPSDQTGVSINSLY